MTTAIITTIGAVAAAIAGYVALKREPNRQRREAEAAVKKSEDEREKKMAEIRHAVYSGDDETLNAIVTKLLAPSLLCACCLSLAGCHPAPRTVYVPTDRRIESCTNSLGIACKAVPDALMVEMLDALQQFRELKTSSAVESRINNTK